MTYSGQPLRFGMFLGPYHKIGLNPTLALEHDLQLIEHLDQLGFHEAWIGEHHSGGVELIASPEVFIAAAAQRTKHIKLGTGVASLPYHHPFMLADRIVQLDHMTRGRMMFGVGPGQLLDDATMMGIEPSTQRARMEEALEVILRLFAGETVTHKSDWFTLNEAVLQIGPYSDFEVAVTGAVSPSGPKLAGRFGTGLLSLAATDPVGVERLAGHWDIVEAEASEHGHTVSRANWRLMGPMHIAETEEQARADVKFGIEPWFRYFQKVAAFPQMTIPGDQIDEMINIINDAGAGVVGTPEQARAQVQRLWDQSGGFGCMLQMGHEWANPAATKRSAELFAAEVIPHFQGQAQPMLDAATRASEVRDDLAQTQLQAIDHMTKKYQDEVDSK